MKKFYGDLNSGNIGERQVANYFQQNGMTILEYNNDYKYDFKGEKGGKILTFEIKTDRWEYFNKKNTGNMFIELTCNNKPSGISSTIADYFVYYYPDLEVFFLIKTEDLRKLIQDEGFSIITQSGDNGKVTGVCINRHSYKEYFHINKIPKDTSIWTD
jgi:hypothetical protein